MELLLKDTQGRLYTINFIDGHVLPQEYIGIEYIENTSTAILNTGITGISEWHITAQLITTTSTSSVLISTSSTNGDWAGSHPSINNSWCTNYNSGYITASSLEKTNLVVKYETNRIISLSTDDETCSATRSSNRPSNNICLFGCANSPTNFPFKGRIYGSVVGKKGEDTVFFGIPCRTTSGAVGLYDTVSHRFIESSRTYKFIAGPDISNKALAIENDYITDGLTNWWDGIYKGGTSGTWKYLVGDIDLTVQGNVSESQKGWNLSGGYLLSADNKYISETYPNATIEAVFRVDSIASGKTVFVFVSGSNSPEKPILSIASDNRVIIGDKTGRSAFTITNWKGNPQRVSITYNNCLINGVTPASATATYKNNNNAYTYVGRRSSSYSDNSTFTGEVYCIRVYNRQLTTEEMAHNQEVDVRRFGLWN